VPLLYYSCCRGTYSSTSRVSVVERLKDSDLRAKAASRLPREHA
jgi:hypothetical protein